MTKESIDRIYLLLARSLAHSASNSPTEANNFAYALFNALREEGIEPVLPINPLDFGCPGGAQ